MAITTIKRTVVNGKNRFKAVSVGGKKEYVKRVGKVKITRPDDIVKEKKETIVPDSKEEKIIIPETVSVISKKRRHKK